MVDDEQPEKPPESVALKLAKMVVLRRMGDFWRAQIALGDEADAYEPAPPGLLEAINRPITDADIREEARLLEEEWRRRNREGHRKSPGEQSEAFT